MLAKLSPSVMCRLAFAQDISPKRIKQEAHPPYYSVAEFRQQSTAVAASPSAPEDTHHASACCKSSKAHVLKPTFIELTMRMVVPKRVTPLLTCAEEEQK